MSNLPLLETDLLVIGGGTADPMAAIKAKQANPNLRVLLLEKAHMQYDERWYCLPCEKDCPVGAATVRIPYLLR